MTGNDGNSIAKAPRKRMHLFRGAEAKDLGHDEMPMIGVDEGLIAGMGEQVAARRAGLVPEETKVVFCEPSGTGINLMRAWFKSGYILPRHSHSTDCLYYVLAGEARFGTQILRPGDGVFVPAGDAYTLEAGPDGVEFLEFRTDQGFNMVFSNNDAAHLEKMSIAFNANKHHWVDEVRPTEKPDPRTEAFS